MIEVSSGLVKSADGISICFKMYRKFNFIFRNMKERFPLICLYTLLLALPCCLKYTDSGTMHFATMRLLTGTGSALCVAILLAMLSVRKWVAMCIGLVLWLLCFNEFFLFMNFHTRMSSRIIASVMQTNPDEAGDFAGAYVLRLPVIQAFMASLSPLVLYMAVRLAWPAVYRRIRSIVAGTVLKLMFIAGAVVSAFMLYIGLFTSLWYEQMSLPTVSQMYFSIRHIQDNRKYLHQLEAAVSATDGALTVTPDAAPIIVYVIGESMNKHHLPLYGYPLQTCPVLTRECNNGNLLVFTSATTPYSATEPVMDMLMSTYRRGDSLPWHKQPLLPAVFRHAGYTVSYHDNQTSRVQADAKWDSKFMWYFNSLKIEKACFDYRNPMLQPYDWLFVKEQLPNAALTAPSLAIFHFKGQHIPARVRYPSDFKAQFCVADYAYRHDLNTEQKRTVAYYDNAVLYGDYAIAPLIEAIADKDAILIFHSDHGEEVHDYRDQYGRTLEEPTPGIRRNIYEIPMVIYTTPVFRAYHPEVYDYLDSLAVSPFSISQMAQLLTRVGYVKTEYVDNGL